MRVLLDEMLPAGLAALLPGHEVTTVKQAGFAGLDNGELLRRAIASGYEVLVTADRGIPQQQNVAASGIAVVLIPGSRLADIRPRVSEIDQAIRNVSPGTTARLERGR